MSIPQTTLEQWAVLHTVMETGSFAKAAEFLNRSQSAVSYAVSQLQERLGTRLLQIEGRKAQLTDAGRTLLAEAMPLIEDMLLLEARARSLSAGHEAQVRLLVDSLFPRNVLFAALNAFQQRYPAVEIALQELVRQTVPAAAKTPYDLAVGIWDISAPDATRLRDVELTAIARRDHPLHQRGPRLTQATLSRHRLVAIARIDDTGPAPRGTGRQWRVNTVEAAVEAVCSGLCYGWLPRHLVEKQLADGLLAPLPLENGGARMIPLCLSFANPERAGPATRAMAELLLAG